MNDLYNDLARLSMAIIAAIATICILGYLFK